MNHLDRRKSLTVEDASLRIWACIHDELALLQDQALEESYGQVVNPISRLVYPQNTACAALVFATEYMRAGEIEWLRRAQMALDSLTEVDLHSGVDEPKWNRLGWHYNQGSLFATGTALDAFWQALNILGIDDDAENLLKVVRYVDACKIRPGLFAHDAIGSKQRPTAVQNTTAIALYLKEVVAARLSASEHMLLGERDITLRLLLKGQRQDGLWPYVYPGTTQKLIFHLRVLTPFARRLPVISRYFRMHDRSIFFGDAVHHCLVLYYLLKSINLRQPKVPWAQAVTKGWSWIRGHLVETQRDGVRFDFDWEPHPTRFRYGNFRDTSTYFLILAMLPLLAELGIVTEDYHRIAAGLLMHIKRELLPSKRFPTSIEPYEGPDEIVGFVLPRVGEASAWKGALLAEFILNRGRLRE